MLCTHHMCGGKNMYVGCMLLHIDTMYTMKAVIASCFDSLKKMSMRVKDVCASYIGIDIKANTPYAR